jgi:hypothetical protein
MKRNTITGEQMALLVEERAAPVPMVAAKRGVNGKRRGSWCWEI